MTDAAAIDAQKANLPFAPRRYPAATLKAALRRMVLIRRFEEGRRYMRGWVHGTMHLSIGQEARAGVEAGVPVGMCGEAAGRPDLIARFVEMGLTELSMSPASIPRAKKIIGGA
jgi:hypothetical protein